MAFSAYATSLRAERVPQDRVAEDGVPFFVPQLSKVKTNVMCQSKNQHLLFCFEKAGGELAFATTSYRKQGNQDFYSPDNLLKRQRLLEDKQVVAALGRFWDTFPIIRQGGQSLDCHDYVDVFMKFYKALVSPSEFSMAEARRIVKRDWERDVGAADVMIRGMFFRALFEVADIWTVGIGADIYASFLNKLYDRVTIKVYDKEKCMWLTVFADIDKIRPFEEVKATSLYPNGSSSTTTVPPTTTTNQDLETAGLSSDASPPLLVASTALDAPPVSTVKAKPPLLRKKTLSVPAGLGSPTKANGITSMTSPEAMGGSLRRLPDLQAVATESVRTMNQGIVSRPLRSPVAAGQPTEVFSSRSDGTVMSPKIEQGTSESHQDGSNAGGHESKAVVQTTSSSRLPVSPTRTTQRGATTAVAATSQRRKEDDAESMHALASPPSTSEIPPQHVRLAMPSIYLSPEITPNSSNEKAARRRIRESMKLAQRLRRITF